MRNKNITFQGLNYTPYGDMSPDGQLESCVGLEMHDGSLRPSTLDGTQYTLPEEQAGIVLHIIHSTSEYSHFIFLSADRKALYWAVMEEGSLSVTEIRTMEAAVDSVKSIGNTLIVLSSSGMHYFLFKDGAYKYLGQKPPEAVIQFTLISERYVTKDEKKFLITHRNLFKNPPADIYNKTGYMELKDEYSDAITLAESAMAARLVSDASDSGRIVYPVLMRYAYRLYDGSSYIMQSSPVLLVPNTDVAPASIYRAAPDELLQELVSTANVSLISYEVLSADLEDWKDIISSVDIFMTDQIYSRKSDVKLTHAVRFSYSEAGQSRNYGLFPSLSPHVGPKTLYDSWIDGGNSESESEGYMFTFHSDEMKEYDFLKKISEASVFYKAKSIKTDEIELNKLTYLFDVEDPDSVRLDNLVFQETLPDDWQSHDTLIPEASFIYNRRLNIANFSRVMFGGYDTTAMMPLIQTEESVTKHYTVYTHIRKESRDIVVRNECSGIQGFYPMYLFYPDADAYRMTVVEGSGHDPSIKHYGWTFDLTPHPFLNGSYWFSSFAKNTAASRLLFPPEVTDSSIRYDNSIATSAVDNPFIFPLNGRNTVGIGRILGLASIVTPLSQGQFGSFDLMIFTDEGNYAATVTDEGGYSNIKPMPRDVCVNPKSITTTDYALVYVSGRGVMTADGSNIYCISEALDGVPDEYFGISGFEPQTFFRDSLIAYDYTGGRLMFSSSVGEKVYVRNKDGLWSTAQWGPFTAVLNVYPYSYIQRGGSILKLDKAYPYDGNQEYEAYLVTRPLKLDSMQKKKIHRLSVEGSVLQDVEILLWGSNDCKDWSYIGASSYREAARILGRSFKYWRIALKVSLTGRQNITGFRLLLSDSKEHRFR